MKMAIFNKSTKYTKEQLSAHYHRRDTIIGSWLKFVYGVFRFAWILLQNLYCVPSYLFLSWIILLPISWIKRDLYSRLENYLYNSLLYIVSSWSLAANSTVVETGDDYKHLIENYPVSSKLFNFKEQINNCSNETPTEDENRFQKPTANEIQSRKKHHSNENGHTNHNGSNGFVGNESKGSSPRPLTPNLINEAKTSSPKVSKAKNQYKNSNDSKFSISNKHQSNGFHRNDLIENVDYEDVGSNCRDDEVEQFDQIEYEIASAAGEKKKCIHRSYKSSLQVKNNNTYESNKVIDSENKLTRRKINSPSSDNDGTKMTTSGTSMLEDRGTTTVDSSLNPPLTGSNFLKNTQAKPRILLLCNHLATGDVPLIMQSLSSLTNQSILWVLDAQFKLTNFGVVCGSHGDFFVAKNSFVDGSLREHILRHPDRNLLVLFPEGGFLRKRIDGSNRFAIRNGLPQTKYVTHPRLGAFKDLIDPSVGVTHIVDATIFYDDIKNPVSILDIGLGNRPEPVIINYKLYNRSEIDPSEGWLRNIWIEKEKSLAKFYEDRSNFLKSIEHTMRVAQLDWFKLLAVHLFYLLVCYLAIFRLFNATSITMLKAHEFYYSNM